jgi:hypothetical protein
MGSSISIPSAAELLEKLHTDTDHSDNITASLIINDLYNDIRNNNLHYKKSHYWSLIHHPINHNLIRILEDKGYILYSREYIPSDEIYTVSYNYIRLP